MNIAKTVSLLSNYPAPLSREPKALARTALWLAGDLARGKRTPPPAGTFRSYFDGIPERQILALFDVNKIDLMQNARFFKGILNSKTVNIVRGCDTQCDYCYALASGLVKSMPWQWVEEIGARLPDDPEAACDISFDGDPLKNYYDWLFDKDLGDAARVLPFRFLPTCGFDIGSFGERAAKKIVYDRDRYTINVNFTLLSNWARGLRTEGYIETMKNALSILRPDCVHAYHNGINYEETRNALEAAGGFNYCYDLCLPHRDGRARNMAENSTELQPNGTPLNRAVFILDPDGTVRFASRSKNTHTVKTIRQYGGMAPSMHTITHCYMTIIGDMMRYLEDCARDGWRS